MSKPYDDAIAERDSARAANAALRAELVEALTRAAAAESKLGAYELSADQFLRERDLAFEARGAALTRAERAEATLAKLGNEHYVIFTEDRWTVEHSLDCRLSGDMHNCEYHAAIARVADDGPPGDVLLGRWRIANTEDEPLLERAPLVESQENQQ